jgi:hypothetical protein
MLTEIYIEALLVDEDLADEVLGLLESGVIDSDTAILEWAMIPIREVSKTATSFAICLCRKD